MINNENNLKKSYSEMYDALRDLNGALTSLLRLNWTVYPWAKALYYDLSRQYDVLREHVYHQRFCDKSQIINDKDDEE